MTMNVEIKNADLPGSLNGLKVTQSGRTVEVLHPGTGTVVYIHSAEYSNVTLSEVDLSPPIK